MRRGGAAAAERQDVGRTEPSIEQGMNRAEAERRLAEIQSGQSPHGLRSATYLQDLQLRLERTAVWCDSHALRGAVMESLRPADIGPATLPANRWDAVDQVAAYRDGLRAESMPERLPPGRLLIYFPDAELTDRQH